MPVSTIRSGVALAEEMRGDIADAVNRVAERVLTVSQDEVPLEEGTLQGTGKIEEPATPETLTASLTYSTPYARFQHERLDLHHPNGRKAKYLSDPVQTVGSVLLLAELRRIARRGR